MSKFKQIETISGQIISVRPNHAKRTFTIKKNGVKYRTLRLSKEEFNSCLHNTGNDWNQFLKSDEYYIVT